MCDSSAKRCIPSAGERNERSIPKPQWRAHAPDPVGVDRASTLITSAKAMILIIHFLVLSLVTALIARYPFGAAARSP